MFLSSTFYIHATYSIGNTLIVSITPTTSSIYLARARVVCVSCTCCVCCVCVCGVCARARVRFVKSAETNEFALRQNLSAFIKRCVQHMIGRRTRKANNEKLYLWCCWNSHSRDMVKPPWSKDVIRTRRMSVRSFWMVVRHRESNSSFDINEFTSSPCIAFPIICTNPTARKSHVFSVFEYKKSALFFGFQLSLKSTFLQNNRKMNNPLPLLRQLIRRHRWRDFYTGYPLSLNFSLPSDSDKPPSNTGYVMFLTVSTSGVSAYDRSINFGS